MKTIEINGVTFELGKAMDLGAFPRISSKGIFNCYNNPSAIKMKIWNSWKDFFRVISTADNTVNMVRYGIRSYNCRMFTIEALVDYNGQTYYLLITKSHNKAFPVI